MSDSITPGSEPESVGYAEYVAEFTLRVRATHFRATRFANTAVLHLYWSIGRDLTERRAREAWGTKVLSQLAADLQREFPHPSEWAERNLRYMRALAEGWPDESIWQLPVARLPWGHVTVLLSRLETTEGAAWCAERAAAEGWSRGVLEHHLTVNLLQAVGEAPSSFAAALEAPDSDLAQHLVKDPCVFEHPAVRHARASAASPVAVADCYGLPGGARAALPSATELQAVITDEIARIAS